MTAKYLGSLHRRKGGIWYLRFMQGGTRYVRSMRTTKHHLAEKRAAEFCAPFMLKDKRETQQVLLDRIKQCEVESRAAKPIATGVPLQEVFSQFMGHPGNPLRGKDRLRVYESAWNDLVSFCAGHGVLRTPQLTCGVAGDWAVSLDGSGRAAHTRNSMVNRARKIWNTVYPDAKSPFRTIAKLREEHHHRQPLSEGEIARLLVTATSEWRRLLVIGMYTALRLGDACLLDWGAIDSVANIITVTPSKTKATGKTVKIPIHSDLLVELDRTAGPNRRGPVCPVPCAMYRKSPALVTETLRDLFERCGIQTSIAVPGRKRRVPLKGFHSLRHRFVTLCMQAGVPRAWVEEIVGHGSDIVNRVYTHLGMESAKATIDALPKMKQLMDGERQ